MGFADELSGLEGAVLDACADRHQWPARIAAAVYAGIDFAVAHPEIVNGRPLELESKSESAARYERIIARFTGFLQSEAPLGERLPGSTDEALVGGVIGLIGDHLRLGRVDRLLELRPDLVLLVLLPYLGFAEAQRWANDPALEVD